MKSDKNKFLKFLKLSGVSLFIGLIIGVIIGVYLLTIKYIRILNNLMYSSRDGWVISLLVIVVILLSLANFFLLKLTPSIDGSGIPYIGLGLKNKRKIGYKKEILTTMLNSFISTLVGFTLGSEGPCVVLGARSAKMGLDIFKVEDSDTIGIACGVGFGCAFTSPLASLCYIFESSLNKINWSVFFRGILMSFVAICISSLISPEHLISISSPLIFTFKEFYIIPYLIFINLLIGFIFNKAIYYLKFYLNRHENSPLIKYRSFMMFFAIMVLNFTCLNVMGSGSNLINTLSIYTSIGILVLILLFRFVITVGSGVGGVTGGLVVPMMTLGSLSGYIVCLSSSSLFGLDPAYYSVIVLLSMMMVFSICTKSPLTATALCYSVLGYSSNNYLESLKIIPIALILFCFVSFIFKKYNQDGIYRNFMRLSLMKYN